METNVVEGVRFFNAGKKIDEHWPFSISPSSSGGSDAQALGKYNFIAPSHGWFTVARELQTGTEVVRVNFPADAMRKYGRRGVVMLEPRHDPATEDPDKALETYPLAPTEALVIERAEALWDQYLEQICSAHFEDVQNAMAQGSRPRAASGFTVHALKLKNYRDPAADFLKGLRAGNDGTTPQTGSSPEILGLVRSMQEQNQLMMSVMMAMATGQTLDPELLKAATSRGGDGHVPVKPAQHVPPPSNAGIVEVEGAARTSLEERIGRRDDSWVKGEGNLDKGTLRQKDAATSRNERTKVAAKEL